VMATMIDWRRQAAARRDEDRITAGEAVGLIMVYDSQYTKDHCTAPTHVPAPTTNATVVKVCRRLVQATAERRFEIAELNPEAKEPKLQCLPSGRGTTVVTNDHDGVASAAGDAAAVDAASWRRTPVAYKRRSSAAPRLPIRPRQPVD
jgi:hypothetical protein